MKYKIALILIIAVAFVYWRGTKTILASRGWDCDWHMVYATCMTVDMRVKNAKAPKFIDIMKTGATFEKLNIKFK